VKDPTTGTVRFISLDRPIESTATITGSVPSLKSVWTVGFVGGLQADGLSH
jgi:hypothetical protein